MPTIRNPILRGFNPDPSIVRVGDDYYIATSTFEWYPGVQIHHSRDLVHWRLLTRPLRAREPARHARRPRFLWRLGSLPDLCGWAVLPRLHRREAVRADHAGRQRDRLAPRLPQLPRDEPRHRRGVVRPRLSQQQRVRSLALPRRRWPEVPGEHALGPPARPKSLRGDRPAGVLGRRNAGSWANAARSSRARRSGSRKRRTSTSGAACYYLITAEGGTGWGHAVTMARSRTLLGPYELHPDTHILTSRHRPDVELQRAGHADLVETPSGETYMVHLCGRPLRNRGRCTLGRETAIQKMTWSADGWLRTADGQGLPYTTVEGPAVPAHPFAAPADREDFDVGGSAGRFPVAAIAPARIAVQPDRAPRLAAGVRPRVGGQRVPPGTGGADGSRPIASAHRRRIEYEPEHFQQSAGLIYYYNSHKFHYLSVSTDESAGKHLRVMSGVPDQAGIWTAAIPLPRNVPLRLRIEVDYERLRFAYRLGGQDLAVGSGAVRRQQAVRRGGSSRDAQLHGGVRRDVLPGHRGHAPRRRLRRLRVPRAGLRGHGPAVRRTPRSRGKSFEPVLPLFGPRLTVFRSRRPPPRGWPSSGGAR